MELCSPIPTYSSSFMLNLFSFFPLHPSKLEGSLFLKLSYSQVFQMQFCSLEKKNHCRQCFIFHLTYHFFKKVFYLTFSIATRYYNYLKVNRKCFLMSSFLYKI